MTGGAARVRVIPLPEGSFRVHPDPSHLPRLRVEEPGRNRFDDPSRAYAVRYSASTLRGCLVETLARFRPDPMTEDLLSRVEGIEEGDVEHLDPARAVGDWLAEQKVGILRPDDTWAAQRMLDLDDPTLLRALDKHPLVRAALDDSGLGTRLTPVYLDQALVRLGGPVGRPITQAMSRAAREWAPIASGMAYWSRLDPTERCWAIWENTPVVVTDTAPLSPDDPEHREAVGSAAALHEILLPSEWA